MGRAREPLTVLPQLKSARERAFCDPERGCATVRQGQERERVNWLVAKVLEMCARCAHIWSEKLWRQRVFQKKKVKVFMDKDEQN